MRTLKTSRSRFRSERDYQEAFKTRLLALARASDIPAVLFKVHGGPYQMGGISDLIGCIAGVFVAIEFKLSDAGDLSNLTKRQRGFLESVAESRGVAAVASPGLIGFYCPPHDEQPTEAYRVQELLVLAHHEVSKDHVSIEGDAQ